MRVGVTLPFMDKAGKLLDGAGIMERARMIEAAGFEAVWMADHLPIPGNSGGDRPDPLMYLALASQSTTRVELGTCIFAVPLRRMYDVAQRFYTLETVAPGRFTIGVGTGSQQREYQGAEMVFEDRFKTMRTYMDGIRKVFVGEEIEELPLPEQPPGAPPRDVTWAKKVGPPRLILGAWFSEPQLKRAASEYDGWMASAGPGARFGGWVKVKEAIQRYRDLGGTRAIYSSVQTDLRRETTKLDDEGMFTLRCQPDEAAERLAFIADLGFDDVILWPEDHLSTVPPGQHRYDYTMEDLELMRSLVPIDPRGPVLDKKFI